jgi:F-type H+-transporting ATPase subunit b
MDSLIETFHIDVKLLLAQIVNFTIVFLVLYFFALKPLLKTMQDRSRKIEKSLDDAEKIEESMKKTEADTRTIITNAKKEASAIIEMAGKQAEEKKAEIIERAKEEIGQIINKEKAQIMMEKEQTLKEIKTEITGLVIAVAEKVLGEKVNSKSDEEIIKKAINVNSKK